MIILTNELRTACSVNVYDSSSESMIESTLNLAVTQILAMTLIVIRESTSTLIENQRGTASDHMLAVMF
jgi:hypothetical protein